MFFVENVFEKLLCELFARRWNNFPTSHCKIGIRLFARVPLQEIVGIGTLNLFLNSLAEKRTVEDASADKKCCGFHSRWVSTSLLSCPTGFLHMLSHGRARNSSVLWIRCWQRLPRRLTTSLESIAHVACEWVPGVVSLPV